MKARHVVLVFFFIDGSSDLIKCAECDLCVRVDLTELSTSIAKGRLSFFLSSFFEYERERERERAERAERAVLLDRSPSS